MKIISLIVLIISFNAQAYVKFDVKWTQTLRKELVVSCSSSDSTCLSLCQKSTECKIPEGSCKDCIGTGLRISQIIGDLGKGIENDGRFAPLNRVLDLVTSGAFVTLVPNDPYNVIDGVNSLSALRKFEALCPVGSKKQVVLLSVDPETRRLEKPEVVVCDFYGWSYFYGLTSETSVLINESEMGLF